MLNLSDEECRSLVVELTDLSKHYRVNYDTIEFGSKWTDIATCAAVLTRSGYWGNSPRERRAGVVNHGYRPASLKVVIKKMYPGRMPYCIYVVEGNIKEIEIMRWWFQRGMLWCDPGGWEKERDRLVGEYLDAKEKLAQRERATYGGQIISP